MTKLDPVVKEVRVPAEPRAAFERFTAGMAGWWPLSTHSVWGDRAATVRFAEGERGRIVEVHADGRESVWGTVEEWDPPRRLVFSWHPGRPEATAQRVEVTFSADPTGTRVRLVHGGWETLGDAAEETRRDYDRGWDRVLPRFSEAAGAAGSV